MEQLNGYIAILRGKRIEIRAKTLLEAKQQAIAELKPRKRDMGLLVCELAELAGEPVIHVAVN